MATTPVPAMTDIPPFPALSDRGAGTYNSKAFDFGTHMATKFNSELLAVARSARDNATDAASSASTANTRANAAAGSASAAGEYVGVAAGHSNTALERAGLAGQHAGAAAASATAAAGSATAAAESATASESSRIQADKRYLGGKASAPSKDNQGAALQVGAVYYDTTAKKIMTWDGAAWVQGVTATAVAGVASIDGQNGAITTKTVNGMPILGAGNIAIGTKKIARTVPTTINAADAGNWFSLSGTMTQPFATPASLGAGWSCFVSNDGTGNITIASSDGRTNWLMYPGEARVFFSDGAAMTSYVLRAYYLNTQVSGNFIKPPGYAMFGKRLIPGGAGGGGGGAGGNCNSSYVNYPPGSGSGGAGGNSGTPLEARILAGDLPNSTPFTVGAGGVGGNGGVDATLGSNGAPGSPTTFGLGGTKYYLTALAAPVGGAAGRRGQNSLPGAPSGEGVYPASAIPGSIEGTGAVVFPSIAGGASANASTYIASDGGSGSTSIASGAFAHGGLGGTTPNVADSNGGNGSTSSMMKAPPGCGGAGGGGGSAGRVGSGIAKGGAGAKGGDGGDGQFESWGII